MDQNQDELQAAINNITNGNGGATAGGAVPPAMMDDDVVSQIENKLGPNQQAPEVQMPDPAMMAGMATSQAPVAMSSASQGSFAPIEMSANKAMYGDPDLDRVRINALNEIRPILETVDIPFEKKFTIYKDIIELTDDKACIEPAFGAAKQIPDDKTRAEALLYIIETIDSLGIKMSELKR